jgi:hypothetical protein
MSDLRRPHPRTGAATDAPDRSARVLITAIVLVRAFFALTVFAGVYTDRLWYRSVGYSGVFTRLLWTKVGLFLIFGLLMAASVAANMVIAYRFRPLFRPASPEQTGLDRYRDGVDPIRTWLVVGVAVVIGLFAGTSARGSGALPAVAQRRAVRDARTRTSTRTSASTSSTCRGCTTSSTS